MPSSFLPAIPASLPSYPKHHGSFLTQTSPSPTLAPTRKRLQHRRPDNYSYAATADADRDSDEDVMRNSLYSDTAFRTSLAGHSRKRGLADDDADDYNGPSSGKRVELMGNDGRPAAKRRIIDVVGSVASRVWEFCISKTPFFAPQDDDGTEFEREVQRHVGLYMPGRFTHSPPPNQDVGMGGVWGGAGGGAGGGVGGGAYNSTYNYNNYNYGFHAATPSKPVTSTTTGGLSSRWVMVSPTPTPARPVTATATTPSSSSSSSAAGAGASASASPRPYTAPSTQAPYSPTTYATTATSSTTATATATSTSTPRSRRNSTASVARRLTPRPILSRAKRPAVVRHKHSSVSSATAFPAPPSQSAFTFGAHEDEDDADESIRRFNEKLKDMIREGREALGSRIEVTYDDDDDLEGF